MKINEKNLFFRLKLYFLVDPSTDEEPPSKRIKTDSPSTDQLSTDQSIKVWIPVVNNFTSCVN